MRGWHIGMGEQGNAAQAHEQGALHVGPAVEQEQGLCHAARLGEREGATPQHIQAKGALHGHHSLGGEACRSQGSGGDLPYRH